MEKRFVQVTDLGDPGRDGTEIEVSRVEARLELLPAQRRRDRGVGERPNRVAGDDLLAVADHLRVDLRLPEPEGACDDVREGSRLLVRVAAGDRDEHVQPFAAARSDVAGEL